MALDVKDEIFFFFSSNPSDIRLQSHADMVPLLFDRTSPHLRVIGLHSSRVNSTVFSRTYYEVSTHSPFVLQSTVVFTLELIQFFNSLLEYHPLQTRELLFLSLAATDYSHVSLPGSSYILESFLFCLWHVEYPYSAPSILP